MKKYAINPFLLLFVLFFCTSYRADANWLAYDSGVHNIYFCYGGPQRAVCFNPADFGVLYPLQIDSLKVMFCYVMNSFTDSIFRFLIYGNDGATLLYQSESLIALREPNWTCAALDPPVVINSGNFYAGFNPRTVEPPYAYPYFADDNNDFVAHSYYGQPGNWQIWQWGEFFFRAFVSPAVVIRENCTGSMPEQAAEIKVASNPFQRTAVIRIKFKNQGQLPVMERGKSLYIYNISGRIVRSCDLSDASRSSTIEIIWDGKDDSGKNLPPGIYIIRLPGEKDIRYKLIKAK